MSIIGEIKDEEIYDLKQEHIKDLEKFANWIADNEYHQIGHDMWAKRYGLKLYDEYNLVYYRTDQLVKKYLKET